MCIFFFCDPARLTNDISMAAELEQVFEGWVAQQIPEPVSGVSLHPKVFLVPHTNPALTEG